MRWEFVGREDAPLGEAVRALARARGWGDEEVVGLLAGLDPPPGTPGHPTAAEPAEDVPAAGGGPAVPAPGLLAVLRDQPAYRAARERIGAAGMGQRIVLFGDYDADGITALAQVHRFLTAAGYRDLGWFVPDRMRHGYGLTKAAAEECLATCREEWARSRRDPRNETAGRKSVSPRGRAVSAPVPPVLLIALDCGTTSVDVIAELASARTDCIVIDHHQPPDLADRAHPAAALLNPHAWSGDEPELAALRKLSASGLAHYVCAALAQDLRVDRWDGAAGLVLAGLGTVADVVPLTGPNRPLVKAAIGYANDPGLLEGRLPGLAKLHELSGGGVVDARTLGYRWGPRVNASGRIEDARQPVELLLAGDSNRSPEAAGDRVRIAELARACERANEDRKERTARVLEHALQLVAERETSGTRDRVLVLWDESWEPGIVGIVAGRLREQLRVPTIVLGKHPGQQVWKGSGRSAGDYDLGAEVRRAVEAGLVLQGGGHHQAAGLTVACDPAAPAGGEASSRRLQDLRTWLNGHCLLDSGDLEPVHEILAPVHAAEALDRVARSPRDPGALVKFWCDLYERFEPFGAGNPRPGLLLKNAELVACQAKTTMKGAKPPDGSGGGSAPPAPRVWAVSGRFRHNGGDSLLADWTDPAAAAAIWSTSADGGAAAGSPVRYDLVLEPHSSSPAGKRGTVARTWYDWRVVACARCETAKTALDSAEGSRKTPSG